MVMCFLKDKRGISFCSFLRQSYLIKHNHGSHIPGSLFYNITSSWEWHPLTFVTLYWLEASPQPYPHSRGLSRVWIIRECPPLSTLKLEGDLISVICFRALEPTLILNIRKILLSSYIVLKSNLIDLIREKQCSHLEEVLFENQLSGKWPILCTYRNVDAFKRVFKCCCPRIKWTQYLHSS